MTLGVSVRTLPTRSCPRHLAVMGGAEFTSETPVADAPAGDGSDVGVAAGAGVAGEVGAAGGSAPAGERGAGDFSARAVVGELGVGAAEGGWPLPADGATGEAGPGPPASGGEDPGGGDPESELRRPKRAAARRILKKYMTTIAKAKLMSSPIVKR